jgi:hypothetical protein
LLPSKLLTPWPGELRTGRDRHSANDNHRHRKGRSVTLHSCNRYSALIQVCADADDACKLTDGLFDLMPPLMVDSVRKAIADLRTWDRLKLRGGRELIGDLLWMHNRNGRIAAEVFESGTVCTLQWRRGLLGIFSLMGWGPFGHIHDRHAGWRPVTINDCVYFHEAGQAKPAVIALRDVDVIEIG